MSALTRTLYRNLLQVAKSYDTLPQFKAFLRLPLASTVPEDHDVRNRSHISKFLGWQLSHAYFNGFRFYHPEVNMQDFIRQAFRADFSVTEGDKEVPFPEGAAQDAAIDLLSRLQQVLAVAHRSFSAHTGLSLPVLGDMQGELNLLPPSGLRTGCMLVEHPALSSPGRGLSILTDTQREATAICINRPVPMTVSTVFNVTGPLGDNVLFVGGSENTKDLFVLHPYADLPGALPLGNNLFVGCSLSDAAEMVEEGKAERTDFKFVAGRDTFELDGPGRPAIPPHYFAVEGTAVSLLALLPSLNASLKDDSENEMGVLLHSTSTWSHVMRRLGGEYEVFADIAPQVMEAFNLAVGEDMDDADVAREVPQPADDSSAPAGSVQVDGHVEEEGSKE